VDREPKDLRLVESSTSRASGRNLLLVSERASTRVGIRSRAFSGVRSARCYARVTHSDEECSAATERGIRLLIEKHPAMSTSLKLRHCAAAALLGIAAAAGHFG
jgi:hypothetical protein